MEQKRRGRYNVRACVCVRTHLETKVRLAEEQVGESGTPWQADYRRS